MAPKNGHAERLDVARTLEGKRLLFVGSTGFVGKVALSMFLRRYPGIGKMFVLVRPGAGSSAEERFFRKVATSPVFNPIREVWGDGFEAFLHEKVVPLPGDVSRPLLNFTEEHIAQLKAEGGLDAVINCAGLVTFDPSLETALRINTYGVKNVVEVARQTGAAVVHVSTCFVAGNRDGEIWEDEPVLNFFPRKEELSDRDAADFTVDGEIADCEKLIAQVRERADDRAHISMFRERGREYLRGEGRDPDDDRNLKVAVHRERKAWVAKELTALGMERAKHWGWTNTYTYSKSLGDQVCAEADAAPGEARVRCCIVRPSIVESALRYPFTGWNEGFTTTAPLTMMTLLGHRSYPMGERRILDIIPVDLVAAGLIAATAATIAKQNKLVYQLASGDENPLYGTRALVLLGLYKRRYYKEREEKGLGISWLNWLQGRLEPVLVTRETFNRTSAPMWRAVSNGLIKKIDELTPRWGAPRVQAFAERAKEKLSEISSLSGQTADAFEIFMPFISVRRYVFRCDQTRALFATLTDEDQRAIPWDPEGIDWLHYWLDVHMRGLEKWVFPSLEEEFKAKPHAVYTYRDLLEMFDTTTKHHRQRTAMRQLPPPSSDEPARRYTYGDLQERALRVAAALRERGVVAGDKVMLLSENRPEWGITYFGILKVGASVVPVDPQVTADEVQNLLRSSRAKAAVISDRVIERLEKEHQFTLDQLLAPRVSFEELLAVEPRIAAANTSLAVLVHKPRADEIASLIFTSGTTGRPKGVMLTHRNFSSLLSKLAGVFDIDQHDGLLSVLPLHHTFEFTAGLLMPLMRGAQINYLHETTAEALGEAFAGANVTGMVGVPALWQLLYRRITKQVSERGPITERSFNFVVEVMRKLRDGAPPALSWINWGKLVFWPVHQRMGGRLRLMISGGSALPVEVMKAFRGLGFGLYEGYGLTEASPVLAVNRPGTKLLPGSVGQALPGVEIKIHQPDGSGVGEVIASGPNVMLGYFEDPEATAEVIREGWLHTGDLGRLDDDKRLFIVGRKKEMILGANGENVYPDELEELFRESLYIKELSIVGLPTENGVGEIVACLAVLDYARGRGSVDREHQGAEKTSAEKLDKTGKIESNEGEVALTREQVREKIREHFRQVSAKLPLYKRVKVLHFTDVELPKTATRKVKRRVVVEEVAKLEKLKHRAEGLREKAASTAAAGPEATSSGWLEELIAAVTDKPAAEIRPGARLEELGFDSLMYTELGAALEAAGVAVPDAVDLTSVATVGELERLVVGWGGAGRKRTARATRVKKHEREDNEIPVPPIVAELGSRALDFGQRMTYERLLDTRVTGKAYVPKAGVFLVAANHSSHLDMGLVKQAIGEWGPRLVALAAKDYFFEDAVKRAYFENFTSLVPMDRHGSLRESLRLANDVVREGYILLIFPEGTRSETGVMTSFKPSIGYLALHNKVGVLPMYLEGTHAAMPKGRMLPKRGARIEARIGPLLSYEVLKERAARVAKTDQYREIARIVEESVRKMAPPDVRRAVVEKTPRVPQIEPAVGAADPASESLVAELASAPAWPDKSDIPRGGVA